MYKLAFWHRVITAATITTTTTNTTTTIIIITIMTTIIITIIIIIIVETHATDVLLITWQFCGTELHVSFLELAAVQFTF
jgi:hypothetical protein